MQEPKLKLMLSVLVKAKVVRVREPRAIVCPKGKIQDQMIEV